MLEEPKLIRSHPISIYLYIYRFLYLLLIPIMRGLIALLTGGILRWLSGAWLDLLILLLIGLLAYQKWGHLKYQMDINGLYYTKGIFIQQRGFIPMDRISTLSTQQPFWLRPLRIVKVRIDTIALHPEKPDLILYVRQAEGERIQALRRQPILLYKGRKAQCRPRTLDIVFLSIFTSNTFIGILYVATFISQAGKILGEDLYNVLFTFFSQITHQIAVGLRPLSALLSFLFRLPPVAMAIAGVLLGSWFLGFLLILLQTKNLSTARTKDALLISGGIIVRKEYAVRLDDISFIDVRQSLLTRSLRLYSVFLNAIGTGKERSDITALIPFSTKRRCEDQLSLLLPEYKITPRSIQPNAGAILKFLLDPLWPCLLIPIATFLSIRILPLWEPILKFAGIMLAIPAFWFLGVRLMDYFSSGISKGGNFYTIRYSNLYYLHTVIFHSKQLAMLNIRQSILQRGDAKCDLKISTRAEGRKVHHIRNLSWDDTLSLFGATDPNPFYLKPSWFDKLNAWLQRRFMKKK